MYHSLTKRSSTPGSIIGFIFTGVIIFAVVVGILFCIRRCRMRSSVASTSTTVFQSASTSTGSHTIARPPGPTYVAPPVPVQPYPPMYQPVQARPPVVTPAAMQQAPPYTQQAAGPGSQPAFNPGFNPDPAAHGQYDAPPAYNLATAGYPPSEKRY